MVSKDIESAEPFYKLVTGSSLKRVMVCKPAPVFKVLVGGEDMLIMFAKGDVYITKDRSVSEQGFSCAVYPD